ncbi:cysteine-rich protein [Pimephales promelas]|nr:cysteine-rich protein [Pimephales promelas]
MFCPQPSIYTHTHRHTQSTQRHIERQRRLVTAVSVIRERTPKISTVCDIYCRIVHKQRVKLANVLSFDCRVLIEGIYACNDCFLFCCTSSQHDGKPYCHKPCYAALFGPKGVNIGGAGSYVYENPANNSPPVSTVDSTPKPQEKWVPASAKVPSKAGSITTFSGEANLCPRCNKKVYFAEKVTSLGKDWHRPCLRCERCKKTLAAGSHAEHNGQPYCHKPCYAVLFGPKGVNTGGVGSYIYDKEPNTEAQP